MRLVDLSHPVEAGMQVFPGDPPVDSRLAASVPRDGFQVAELHLSTHSGTHVDAPLHTVDGGPAVDELDLSRLVGPARIVHVPGLQEHEVVRWEHVRAQLEDVRAGTIVLFRTDWSRHFGTPRYLAHPVLDVEIAEHLLSAGVQVLGTDTLNPDRTPDAGSTGPLELPVHAAVLGAGGAIIENLTNLHTVDWPNPLLSALPLRLRGLDGSPVRAVAMQL
ncbi:UNVERIFIED_CONTAM: cyclase family protein [Kocuria sp. CPCC 205316]|uniref:cyclase family protein n=1 Tax=Kocuria TaxID=57493 RepID=UPI0036DE04A4